MYARIGPDRAINRLAWMLGWLLVRRLGKSGVRLAAGGAAGRVSGRNSKRPSG